jgi:predicted MFS family arabinose efflux permease
MLGVLRRPRVAALATVTTLTMTGTFVVFAYVAPLVGLIAGGGTATVAAALLVFGVFAVLGNALGGAATDRVGSRRTLVAGLGVLALSLAALWVFANLGFSSVVVWGAAVASAAWSACNWAFNPPQQERLLEAAPDAGGLAPPHVTVRVTRTSPKPGLAPVRGRRPAAASSRGCPGWPSARPPYLRRCGR